MDNLLKAAENFVDKTSSEVEENFNEQLFLDFMKKVPIWEFYCISKQAYLAMSEQEKREKISKYYSDMKSRNVVPVGEFLYSFLFCSLVWRKYFMERDVSSN